MDPITAIFTGQEIARTAKDTDKNAKQQLKAGTNKYDKILKNQIIKAPGGGGVRNAVNINPMFRNAGEKIDFLYKVASDNRQQKGYNRGNRDRRPYNKNKPYDAKEEIHLREINDNDKSSLNPYLTAGGAVLGSAALQALLTKDPMAPVNSARKGTEKFIHKIPRKTIGKNKTVRNILDVIKTGTKPVCRTFHKDATTSEFIDKMFEKTASDRLKSIIRDDFIRGGIESIPYSATPAALRYFTNKSKSRHSDESTDHDSNVTQVVIDVPIEYLYGNNKKKKYDIPKQISPNNSDVTQAVIDIPIDYLYGNNKKKESRMPKQASEMQHPKSLSWKEWALDTLPRRVARGLGTTILPAIVINVTGRNIKGGLEKKKSSKKNTPINAPLPNGMARIIVQTNGSGISKKASQKLDDLVKIASSVEKTEKNIKKSIENTDTEKQKKKEMQKQISLINYDDLKQGILKQRRMKE
mgnify:CR=1 FL=1